MLTPDGVVLHTEVDELPGDRGPDDLTVVLVHGWALSLDICHLSLRKGARGEPGYQWKRVYVATERALRRKGLIEYEGVETFTFHLTDRGREVYAQLKNEREGS